jgi:hypothetical protein
MSSGSAGRGARTSSQQIRMRSPTSRLPVRVETPDPLTWMPVREWAESLKFVPHLMWSAECALVLLNSWALGPPMRTRLNVASGANYQIEVLTAPMPPAQFCSRQLSRARRPSRQLSPSHRPILAGHRGELLAVDGAKGLSGGQRARRSTTGPIVNIRPALSRRKRPTASH